MRTLIKANLIFIAFVFLTGCTTSTSVIKQKFENSRAGIFNEYQKNSTISVESTILLIKMSFKTHKKGFYPLESNKNSHGQELYPVAFNIDGQSVEWKIEGKGESGLLYDIDGKRSKNPEDGNGVRYILEKKIVLAPGKHRIFFALPNDSYYKEFDIYLSKGDSNIIELKPVYYASRNRIRSFLNEIKSFDAYYNGALLQ